MNFKLSQNPLPKLQDDWPPNDLQEGSPQFMRRAIQLAALGAGSVSPNPQVGAVIVYENRVIGEGYHRKYGGKHAEVEAVENVKIADLHLLCESTIYVTLEPCFHTGKTPPCVDLLLKHGIPRVIIACLDPNPLVAGQSVKKLEAAGVRVIIGFLESEARQIAIHFLTRMEKKRPYIILKWAQTADGFIGRNNESVWLTNEYSKRLVHKWRSEIAAIAVGSTTLKIDNPSLTTRLWSGKSPARITWLRRAEDYEKYKNYRFFDKTPHFFDKNQHIFDKNQHIFDKNHHIFDKTPHFFDKNEANEQETRVFLVHEQTNIANLASNDNKQLKTLQLPFDTLTFFADIIQYLHQNNIDSILIEGGRKTLQAFIDNDLWDEARVFIAPIYLENGIPAPVLTRKPSSIEDIKGDKLVKFFNQ